MSGTEFLVLLGSGFFTWKLLYVGYKALWGYWPAERARPAKLVLGGLVAAYLVMICITLATLAAFDVAGVYVLMYILLGFATLYFGLWLMGRGFDLSWRDDGLERGNPAALAAIAGGGLGISLIYCGANIGDGPGWWCVVFAGGLGFGAFFLLGWFLHLATHSFERITVGRSLACGIRFGGYLLASGLVLARASGGDWTSFDATITEFILGGWPVLPLALVAGLVERFYMHSERQHPGKAQAVAPAVLWVAVYLLLAVGGLVLVGPFTQNDMWRAW